MHHEIKDQQSKKEKTHKMANPMTFAHFRW